MFDWAPRRTSRATFCITGRGGDQVGEGELTAGLLVEALHFLGQGIDPQQILHRDLEALGADRLDDEIVGAGPHRLDHGFDRALRRLDDDRNAAAHAVEPRQQLEAVHARHDEIEHDQIDRPGPRLGEKIERRRRAVGEQRVMAATADHAVQETPLGRIVVNDENAMGHGNSLACQSCRSIGHAIGQDHLRPLARPIAVIWWSRHWQRSVKRLLMTRRIETVRCPG